MCMCISVCGCMFAYQVGGGGRGVALEALRNARGVDMKRYVA